MNLSYNCLPVKEKLEMQRSIQDSEGDIDIITSCVGHDVFRKLSFSAKPAWHGAYGLPCSKL